MKETASKKEILDFLKNQTKPLSAAKIAEMMNITESSDFMKKLTALYFNEDNMITDGDGKYSYITIR